MNREQMQMTDNGEANVVSGIVEAIVYQNEENGYTVCAIETSPHPFGFAQGIGIDRHTAHSVSGCYVADNFAG